MSAASNGQQSGGLLGPPSKASSAPSAPPPSASAASTSSSVKPVKTKHRKINKVHSRTAADATQPLPHLVIASLTSTLCCVCVCVRVLQQHPEFELTYDMMLGIRTVVSKTEAQLHGEVLSAADYTDTIKLQFPGRGSILTPAHAMRDFKFKDYAPAVYKKIRDAFHINPADYLLCLCGNFQFLEFISNSKSGQFFFYTHDRQFMIKTVSQAECKFLQRILPHYYTHVAHNPNTLLTKFFVSNYSLHAHRSR